MGKIIRRIITITITETWTITWATEDETQSQATTVVQDNSPPYSTQILSRVQGVARRHAGRNYIEESGREISETPDGR
jgi:hypothetical protein